MKQITSSKASSSTRESKEAAPAENVEEIEVLETTVDTDPGIPTFFFFIFKVYYCTSVDELYTCIVSYKHGVQCHNFLLHKNWAVIKE